MPGLLIRSTPNNLKCIGSLASSMAPEVSQPTERIKQEGTNSLLQQKKLDISVHPLRYCLLLQCSQVVSRCFVCGYK